MQYKVYVSGSVQYEPSFIYQTLSGIRANENEITSIICQTLSWIRANVNGTALKLFHVTYVDYAPKWKSLHVNFFVHKLYKTTLETQDKVTLCWFKLQPTWHLFHEHGLILIPVWICNHMCNKM